MTARPETVEAMRAAESDWCEDDGTWRVVFTPEQAAAVADRLVAEAVTTERQRIADDQESRCVKAADALHNAGLGEWAHVLHPNPWVTGQRILRHLLALDSGGGDE